MYGRVKLMEPMLKGMISVPAFFAEDDLSEGVVSQTELLVSQPTSFIGVLFDHALGEAIIRGAKLGKIQGGCRFDKWGVTKFF